VLVSALLLLLLLTLNLRDAAYDASSHRSHGFRASAIA
jgi:hypothetical protein